MQKFTFQMNEQELDELRIYNNEMLDKLFEMAKDYDMLVMDESVYAIKSNLLDEEKLITHLEEKPVGLEVVLAGRNPSQKLMDHADYVSEIQKVKHPFDQGVSSRVGIELQQWHIFRYLHKSMENDALLQAVEKLQRDENKYDTELENTLDKRYSSNSNLKNISYDLEISENLLESLSADLSEDLLKIRKNTFLEKEIGKAFLVVAATSNREENHHIAELCHAYNVLVNVADSEEESSFIFPSVVRKGDISIGINSGTGSPTVSKHIRKQIEKAVPDYYADIAVFMGKLREYVKANFKEESQRRYILKTAAAEAFAEERVLTQKEIEEIIRQGPK